MPIESFESWAIVELLGHVRMAGRLTEEERFGGKMGRLDVPIEGKPCRHCRGRGQVPDVRESGEAPPALTLGDYITCAACDGHGEIGAGWTTVYFGAQSVYRCTVTTEELARQVAAQGQPRRAHALALPSPEEDDGDDYEEDEP